MGQKQICALILCVYIYNNVVYGKVSTLGGTSEDSDSSLLATGTCSSSQFRCSDGSCIPVHWVCDSHVDCRDGSDEAADCSEAVSCREGQFQCTLTKRCIPQSWRCDGESDCGTSPRLGPDSSDEDPRYCHSGSACPPNQAHCGELPDCRPIEAFCDGREDCPDNSDEWKYCVLNKTQCRTLKCEHGCGVTPGGPMCYCPTGTQPDGAKCVDADECQEVGTCAQLCFNTPGSYVCSCASGYTKNGSDCIAVNVPSNEPTTLILSTQLDIRRVLMDGKNFSDLSFSKILNVQALEVNHRNRTICYVHNNITRSSLVCANADDFSVRWKMPDPSLSFSVESIQQMAYDWLSLNWYFMDEIQETLMLCEGTMKHCAILLEQDLNKPRGMALDPLKGYVFFTRWGTSVPMLERVQLDGTERTSLVSQKLVYPFGVTADIPSSHVYWVDNYLDSLERCDYDGKNRYTVKRGDPVQAPYAVSVFENDIYLASWRNKGIIKINKVKKNFTQIVTNISRPFNIHIFHRQRQPDKSPRPCKKNNGGCEHICVSLSTNETTIARCLCASGYQLQNRVNCSIVVPDAFLLLAKLRPASIRGVDLVTGKTEVSVPITKITQPGAIDYDAADQQVFYSDNENYTISSSTLNGTYSKIIVAKGLDNCEGLAFDWMGHNLYWSEQVLGTVSVVSLANVSHQATLIREKDFHPRNLALDPASGFMYFGAQKSLVMSDRGMIGRAWMDGTNYEVMVETDCHWPTGIAIDFAAKKLYWSDGGLLRIDSIGLDKTGRQRFASLTNIPYGLSVFGSSLYYAEHKTGLLMSMNMKTKALKQLEQNFTLIYDVRVFSKSLQQGTNACSRNRNGCPELCLATPDHEVCTCTDGFIFIGGRCAKEVNYTAPPRCSERHFQCSNSLRCIPKRRVCDGVNDCGDNSDEHPEKGCHATKCPEEGMYCDGKCIAQNFVCDGDKDCSDGADENPTLCKTSTQQPCKEFTCNTTGRCIPKIWTCDGFFDCGTGDYSDEQECHSSEEEACEVTDFKCNNKRCISPEMYCDGDDDCMDGSDEINCKVCDSTTEILCLADQSCLPIAKLCDKVKDCPDGSDEKFCETRPIVNCSENFFNCPNFGCLPKMYQCDGRLDCLDGSDEKNCDQTRMKNITTPTIIKNATCEHPSRFCDNNTRCVPVQALCDGRPDCQDGSDEGLRCDEELCDRSLICSHECHNAPEGLVCYCPKNLFLQINKRTCGDKHPCQVWGACSQVCVENGTRHKCDCLPGYALEGDDFTCRSTNPAVPYVIFSNRHELRGIDLQTFSVKVLISNLKNTIALDFYYSDEGAMVFWTDVVDDKIYRGVSVGNSLSNIEAVVQTGLATAEGLAVDWIGQNLYWVESNLDQIEVARLNGSFRRTLVAGDMDSPRAIALDPRDGLLFWTDWDNAAPRIERCSLAGNARKTVVRVDQITDGAWPNGLTLDYDTRRIYWIDARSDSVHTTNYDGDDLHEVIRGHETLSHPFAIALYENYLYWTDWRTNSVIRANKWTGGDVSVIQRTLTQPFDIQILHPSRQPRDGPSPCGTNNGGCSHLCLIDGKNTFKCDCPHVMRLDKDKRTCIVNERVLLFSRTNEIRGVDLTQPYYHTIPTMSQPQVLTPSQLEFVASDNTLYWADSQLNEVKRSGLTKGPMVTLIDTGLEHPTGLAVDWASKIMFVSSPNGILACNLDAEFSTIALPHVQALSIAVDPAIGMMYFISKNDTSTQLEESAMDGSRRQTLVPNLGVGATSLSLDLEDKRLYYVSNENINYFSFDTGKVSKVALPDDSMPSTATIYQGVVYYADNVYQAILTANKTTGANNSVLRNNTGNVLALRIYDPTLQKGNNSCGKDRGGCQHLCLPTSSNAHVCRCATGYKTDPSDPKKCIGEEEFIFYSINWEIRGLALNGDNTTQVLGPISRVSMASSVDYHAASDYIYWADSDHGHVTRIGRDGTRRKIVVDNEAIESDKDWLTGLAIDWAAGNMYWTDPKRNVIEVARLDGSARYVVVAYNADTPNAICLDPAEGLLVWAGNRQIESAALDGSNRQLLLNKSVSVTDITLDYARKQIYWCDTHSNTIERMNYNGTDQQVLLNHSLETPFALTLLDDTLFWIDTTHERGSIKSAPVTNLSDFRVLLRNAGDSLKDIKIFSSRIQRTTNACSKDNGGCQELCLFNGTHPVCACPHGRVAKDGKSCLEYDAFIMYSRMVRIDSIHMTDATEHNAPFPSLSNKDLMRNAIGLTFDYNRQRLFYSDIQRGSINTVLFNGTNHSVVVERQGSVEGLAFEQLTNSLYWTCNSEATISRVNLTDVGTNRSQVEVVVRLHAHDKLRGIGVDSCGSRVYWSNWNSHTPSIDRAYLSGYGRESIITTDIRMPNALTLDHRAQKLYWGDARLDKIERTEYDGTGRIVLAKVTPHHPFDLAVYGDYLFWTDWVLRAVIRVDKITGQGVVWLRKDVSRPMGIIAVANDTNDCFSNQCLILNGGCEESCSLTANGQVQCACVNGGLLAPDGRRCLSKDKICNNDSFRCSDGGCVPFELTCDGIEHCADGTDEVPGYCGHRQCQPGWFQCTNRRCIQANLTCDSVDNCGDNSDEKNCSCSDDVHFKCGSGECILSTLRCDKDPDCYDSSDEIGCEKRNCSQELSDMNMMDCPNTTSCVHVAWFCDGEDDCWDGSDELNCPETTTTVPTCPSTKFQCANGRCLTPDMRCDGQNDCEDGGVDGVSSDEKDCKQQCRPDQFLCKGNTEVCKRLGVPCPPVECIPIYWECDGHPDCVDQSDESEHCRERECGTWEFLCNTTGRCIPNYWVCDGEPDCLDEVDEHESLCKNICTPNQFQCAKERKCVPKEYFCDGDADCNDRSDEPENCKHLVPSCLSEEYRCTNGKCVPTSHTCNGHDDCGDNSDENKHMCKDQRPEDYCKGPDLFLCSNNLCINDTLLCDGENNCGDFSDEKKCNINECDASPCSQTCTDKPIGYECSCGPGYKVNSKDTHLCEDVNECEDRPCSQKCRNTHGSYHCSCVAGYSLRSDKHSCRANSPIAAKLILANRYYVRELDLEGTHSTVLAHNLTNAVALDWDWPTQCLYWSEVTAIGSTIKSLCNSTRNGTAQLLHSTSLKNPDGLAIDWVGRNLYWCDKGMDTLEVSTLDGRYRKALITEGLEEPRAIALDPLRSTMYWTDWGSRVHIGKAGMDGSNQRVIVNENLGWPNALTIAYDTLELFWADAREDYIAVSDLEGKNIRIIVSREKKPSLKLHHVFAISVWEDFMYWSDWETKSVERCHKYSGDKCSSLITTVHRPMDLRIVHPYRQTPSNKTDLCKNSGCAALCLLSPDEAGYTCACPENFILGPDGKSCEANCTSAHFVCASSYKCIPFWWKCDRQDDCLDGSDEPENCPPFLCMPGQYQCQNGHCIHPSNLCDGTDDCKDNSDESDCENYTCLNTGFKCSGNGTARCIPAERRCDGKADCPDAQDEINCPPVTCPPTQYKCKNGKCIPSVWVCDGDNDCLDDSDEQEECHKRTCPDDYFRCYSGRCIPLSWKCDGDPDCSSREDEPSSCGSPEYHSCEPTYFKCANNKCIPGRWKCDYENDCGDNSDEVNCQPRNCSESEFRCDDGRCIHGKFRCDGEFNCDSGVDELGCNTTCGNNEFQCTMPEKCIFIEWKCDGDTDCADGSDEQNCSDTCANDGFKCDNGHCINEEWRCDGQKDCEEGSDEAEAMCASLACPPGRLRCRNNKCVPPSVVCDGQDQCGDGSDEAPNACKLYGRCLPNQFKCNNDHCLDHKLRCDGMNDCGDNSDEEGCTQSPCRWGVCSQLCVEKKLNGYVCKCNPGYNHYNASCLAQGKPAGLMLAIEAELRLMSPYKAGAVNTNQLISQTPLTTASGYKVDSVDILVDTHGVTAFWTDHQNKQVHSMPLSQNRERVKRDNEQIKVVLQNLNDPRGLAVDWINKRIYLVDGNRLLVSSIDGHLTYTLLSGFMQQPRDIVVAPEAGLLFWSDWGPAPRIETAYMDGNKRRGLITTGILWPTGLAIDHPAGRLYWADPKVMVIESVKLDGSDRQLVKRFTTEERPFKVEVFEDSMYVSSYHTHNILRLDKFGRSDGTHLIKGLPRLTDIIIVQENKQDRTIPNRCTENFCHSSEFCLLSPGGATCQCADGFVKDNLTCTAVSTPTCNLNCNTGVCQISPNQGPRCVCPPQYAGLHCEFYRCSQYCRNKGMCYMDLLSAKPGDGQPPLKCNCPPQWTGERCENPVHVCDGHCYNDGVCYTLRPGLPQCNCKSGFTGPRCQHCLNVTCHNSGVCTKDGCVCAPGYTGPSCESSVCDGFCLNSGSCTITPYGPHCNCTSQYSGKRCDQDTCKNHCQNGGVCRLGNKQPECDCPALFSGRRCEVDLCKSSKPPPECALCSNPALDCHGHGNCEVRGGQPFCLCEDQYGGEHCEVYIGNDNPCIGYCLNAGVCTIESIHSLPQCHCDDAWSGGRCETATACNLYCQNGGVCVVMSGGSPYCQCEPGYEGAQCERSLEVTASETKGSSGPLIFALLVCVGLLVVVVVGWILIRRRQPFMHARLQDNMEIPNPMYSERGDTDEFTLDADKTGSFGNPVYDSMYTSSKAVSSGCSGNEEKTGLLQNSGDETGVEHREEI